MSYGKPIYRKLSDGDTDFDGYEDIFCDQCGSPDAVTNPHDSKAEHLCSDCIREIDRQLEAQELLREEAE